MLGGGFLGQMHQTQKQNRELIKSVTRGKASTKGESSLKRDPLIEEFHKELSEEDKAFWKRG
jgi:hypothetical protein